MDDVRIAVIGATGAVGQVFLKLLEERDFPASQIRLCASERSLGKRLIVNDTDLIVESPTEDLFNEVDMVFISATGDVSQELAPIAVGKGCLVIDDSSVFRMDPDVPLVVPEVNPGDIDFHRGIIAIPNCSTTPLVMVLKPLNDINPVKRVIVDTYQSVSGTGSVAVNELSVQSKVVLDGGIAASGVYPHPIAFNVLPHIESFMENAYTREEMKMLNESRKILHTPNLKVSATCVRVPVMVGHSESIHIEMEHNVNVSEMREILSESPGIRMLDVPNSNLYPMPLDAEGEDDVFVGRLRQDISGLNSVAMWVVCDNLRKGAALNAIQIAELILKKNLI